MDCPDSWNWLAAAIGAGVGLLCGVLLTVVVAAIGAAGETDLYSPRIRPRPQKRRYDR